LKEEWRKELITEYKPIKYLMRSYPICSCEHSYYDHMYGFDMSNCQLCTCPRYVLIRSKFPKNACDRCYNIIPKGKIHKKIGIFHSRQEKCIEIG